MTANSLRIKTLDEVGNSACFGDGVPEKALSKKG
jgi:hypothetical protein